MQQCTGIVKLLLLFLQAGASQSVAVILGRAPALAFRAKFSFLAFALAAKPCPGMRVCMKLHLHKLLP